MKGSVGADAAAGTRRGRVSRLNVRSRVLMRRPRPSRTARGTSRATFSPPANRNRWAPRRMMPGAAETNTAVRVRVDVAPGTRAVTPWRRWPDARRWKYAACSLFTPKRLRPGGSVPEPVLWANQLAAREVVTDIELARTRPARLVCRRPKRCPRRMRRHEGSTCAVAARR